MAASCIKWVVNPLADELRCIKDARRLGYQQLKLVSRCLVIGRTVKQVANRSDIVIVITATTVVNTTGKILLVCKQVVIAGMNDLRICFPLIYYPILDYLCIEV